MQQHAGAYPLRLVDANDFSGKGYRVLEVGVNAALYEQVKANPLFVRTLDTGSADGRAGLYFTPEVFGADGIVVTKVTYRTHPIQVFLEPRLPLEDLRLLRDYLNLLLEHFRALTDSEFMTTYKYSQSAYTRKYLGLSQAKALIETFPYLGLSDEERERLRTLVYSGNAEGEDKPISYVAFLDGRYFNRLINPPPKGKVRKQRSDIEKALRKYPNNYFVNTSGLLKLLADLLSKAAEGSDWQDLRGGAL